MHQNAFGKDSSILNFSSSSTPEPNLIVILIDILNYSAPNIVAVFNEGTPPLEAASTNSYSFFSLRIIGVTASSPISDEKTECLAESEDIWSDTSIDKNLSSFWTTRPCLYGSKTPGRFSQYPEYNIAFFMLREPHSDHHTATARSGYLTHRHGALV